MLYDEWKNYQNYWYCGYRNWVYGVKSEDGRRFMKSEEISRSFMESPAYEILFEELVTNDKAAADFVNAVMNVGNSTATSMISTNTQN